MLKTFIRSSALVAAMLAGCDESEGDEGDGGVDAGGYLQSGVYAYSNIVAVPTTMIDGGVSTDGCDLELDDAATPIQLVNTGTQISLGKLYTATTDPAFTPSGYGLGSGPYTTPTTATLSVDAGVKFADGCEHHVMRTTAITYTGNNMLAVDYTDKQSNHTAACDQAMTPCTSRYRFDLTWVGPLP